MRLRLTPKQARALGVPITGPTAPPSPGRATRAGSPEWILKTRLTERWPDRAIPEYRGAVPGRRFRLDVGFPDIRLAVECDGWAWHGRHKSDFKRDRERDRALLLAGWRVLRFFASEIRRTPDQVVETVAEAIATLERGS